MRWLFDGTIGAILSHYMRVIVHKWYLVVPGFKLRVPILRIFLHDLSKFGLSEALAYSRHFFMDDKRPQEFRQAWLHHQNHNDHHWEYHIIRSQKGSTEPEALRMPRSCAREMVADWMSASKAYAGSWDMTPWLIKNWHRIVLHESTKQYVLKLLEDLGYVM